MSHVVFGLDFLNGMCSAPSKWNKSNVSCFTTRILLTAPSVSLLLLLVVDLWTRHKRWYEKHEAEGQSWRRLAAREFSKVKYKYYINREPTCPLIEYLNMLPRDAGDFPSLETLKTPVDVTPSNLLCLALLWAGIALDGISRDPCQHQFSDSVQWMKAA